MKNFLILLSILGEDVGMGDMMFVCGLCACVVSALVVVVYILALKKKDYQSSLNMGMSLNSHNQNAHSGFDPNAKLKIDDLRRKFDEGVKKFKAAGKDLYSLPWYVVVGEPGSGKTEAIRHSNIGFPPGLQDELQGTGGTINMNWWFTNHAIMLDTAGRLLFEDIQPGKSNEWLEFLRLLRKSRPDCPINGMILVIPADSLIKDNHNEIMAKAQKIASQLNDIQHELDIRFPVFVLISKSDLIMGFREFFENVKDPILEQQILGWSNPAELDAPFNPQMLEEYMQGFISDINKRKFALLNGIVDGRIEKGKEYAFYPFSESLKSILPNLRKYLETIFVGNQWGVKPLFLRGIYFTSSMQEGEALDAELAKALGINIDDLPEGCAWERDKSYFLKDVYLEKIFKEKGLVIRATNTKALMRRRRLAMISVATLAPLMVLLSAWFANRDFEKSVGEQYAYFAEVAKSRHWQNNYWVPRIISARKTGYSDTSQSHLTFGRGEISLIDFHKKVAELKDVEIRIPKLFAVFPSDINEGKRKAQRLFYEEGVFLPIINSAREKVSKLDTWDESTQLAFGAFLDLEADTINDISNINIVKSSSIPTRLMHFACGDYNSGDMAELFVKTYSRRGDWKAQKFSGGTTLKTNIEISKLFDLYKQHIQEVYVNSVPQVEKVKVLLSNIEKLEQLFNEIIKPMGFSKSDSLDVYSKRASQFLEQSRLVKTTIQEIQRLGICETNDFLFKDAFAYLSKDITEKIQNATRGVSRKVPRSLVEIGDNTPELSLFSEISSTIKQIESEAQNYMKTNFDSITLGKMDAFDSIWLKRNSVGLMRYEAYDSALLESKKLLKKINKIPAVRVGELNEALAKLNEEFDSLNAEVYKFSDPYSFALRSCILEIIKEIKNKKINKIALAYIDAVNKEIDNRIDNITAIYSVGATNKVSKNDIQSLYHYARSVVSEIASNKETMGLNVYVRNFEATLERISLVANTAKMLVSQHDGTTPVCEISLIGERSEMEELKERGIDETKIAGRRWTTISVDVGENQGKKIRTRYASTLTSFDIDANTLSFRFFKSSSQADKNIHDKISRISADWIALKLVNDPSVLAMEKNRRFLVTFTISEGTEKYYQLLTLGFSRKIPLLEDWQKLKSSNKSK